MMNKEDKQLFDLITQELNDGVFHEICAQGAIMHLISIIERSMKRERRTADRRRKRKRNNRCEKV